MKKNLFLLLAGFFCFAVSLRAQVGETEKSMALGTHTALVLDIPQADDRFVAKVWNNYLRDFYKTKTKQLRGGGEILAEGLSIPALNPGGTVDLYAMPEKAGNDVRFYLWVKLPQGYLNSKEYEDQYKDGEALLRRFAVEVNKEKIRMDLTNQEKELASLERDLKRLQGDNTRLYKEIEDAKARIKKAEENIAQNEKDQRAAEEKIENQKKAVDSVKKSLEEQR